MYSQIISNHNPNLVVVRTLRTSSDGTLIPMREPIVGWAYVENEVWPLTPAGVVSAGQVFIVEDRATRVLTQKTGRNSMAPAEKLQRLVEALHAEYEASTDAQ